MKKLLFLSILSIQITTSAQSWKYESGGSDFDGKYKTSYVKGSGSKFPYNDPVMAINKYDNSPSVNFYISSAGYFQEDTGVNILWVFNNEPNVIYSTYDWSYSADNKILFFKEFNDPNSDNKISSYEFMEKLKSASKVSVRISDKYGSNDLVFSLSGSTKAIDFVLPNLKDLISGVESERKIKNEFKQEKKIELNKLLGILQNQKISETSMSILKNKIETDLGIGLLGQEGTGESYASIKLSPYKQKGMFENYGYVDVFYVLEDGTEKEIYGSYKVDMDSPLFKQIEEEKLLKKKQLEEEKLLREKKLKEEKLLKEKQLEEEKNRLRNLLSKYQNSDLTEKILDKIIYKQKYSNLPKWQLSQVKDVKTTFSDLRYGKIRSLRIKVILKFTDKQKKLNAQIVKKGYLIIKDYLLDIEITKKSLKQMGQKIDVEF